MHRRFRMIAVLAAVLLLLTGCGHFAQFPTQKEPLASSADTVPADTQAADNSLAMLRQTMAGGQELFAVAYLGQLEESADIPAYIRENNPQLLQSYPFIGQIPREHILGTQGEIYCIIPRDKNAAVLVTRTQWDTDHDTVYADTIYRAESGSPFILLCNSNNILDTYMTVTSPKGGSVSWWPGIDDSFTISLPYEDGMHQARDISLYEAGPRDIYHNWYQQGWTLPYEETLSGTQWTVTGTSPDGREAQVQLILNRNGTASLSWNYIGSATQEYYHGSWNAWLEHRAFLGLNLQRTGGVLHNGDAAFADSFAVLLSPQEDRLLLGFSFQDTGLPLNPVEKDVLAIFDRMGR